MGVQATITLSVVNTSLIPAAGLTLLGAPSLDADFAALDCTVTSDTTASVAPGTLTREWVVTFGTNFVLVNDTDAKQQAALTGFVKNLMAVRANVKVATESIVIA